MLNVTIQRVNIEGKDQWKIRELLDSNHIPVAIWDPDKPDERASKYSNLSRPIRVKLEAEDILYLPSGWYHKVTQTCGPEGYITLVGLSNPVD